MFIRVPTQVEILRGLAHQKEWADFMEMKTPESKAFWEKYLRELREWMDSPSTVLEAFKEKP